MKDNYNSLGITGLVVKVARIVSNERVMVEMAALMYSSCSVALVGWLRPSVGLRGEERVFSDVS